MSDPTQTTGPNPRLGCLNLLGLFVAAVISSLPVARIAGSLVDEYGCPPHEECYRGILFGLNTFAISLPILLWLFIFLAIRSRKKHIDTFGAARSDRPNANGD